MAGFFSTNWDKIIGISLAFFTVLLPLHQFITSKNLGQRDKRFQSYNKLIDDLLSTEKPGLERQIAIIFELRNFKEYYPVTLRILEGLQQSLKDTEVAKKFPRVITEIELTKRFIKRNSSGRL
jgi:hypothetical protein